MFRFGLRAKILVFSSFLFAIPYMGYQYVWELETYLRIGQEQTLVGTARAVATALHERPSLFSQESAFLNEIEPGKDLYAHQISQPIRLDGQLQDWSSYQAHILQYDERNLISQNQPFVTESLQFKHIVGQYGRYLYAMFDVQDDNVINRNENMLSIHKNDFIQVALRDEFGQFQRYLIAPYQSGWVNAYLLSPLEDENPNIVSNLNYRPAQLERRIQGYWQNTPTGYQVELRFPLSMMQGNIAFAIGDVDDEDERNIRYTMGTADPESLSSLGTVIVPSPEIEQIIQGLAYADARVWIVDKHQRVLARSGDIQNSSAFQYEATQPEKASQNWYESVVSQIYEYVLKPIYNEILTTPPQTYLDELANATALEGEAVNQAIQGNANTQWRLSTDSKAVILSAAHPIYVAEDVMGAVVVEQTTHGIRTLRNQALEQQFNFFITVIILGTVALFFLASRISSRIRNLRNNTDNAIDTQGKITGSIPVQSSQDEIGDLSRSFASMLSRLGQYNQYLEKMASRLSHELRTPVAVVKSSLENLELIEDKNSVEAEIFVKRAQSGLARLSHILNSMSEATRLEQMLEQSEHQPFDVVGFLKEYTESVVIPEYLKITFESALNTSQIKGSTELFGQMLDKIISNAIDFATPHTSIDITLDKDSAIRIQNTGNPIQEDMQDSLFDSMVSVRAEQEGDSELHLGLGLYIAKLIAQYHGMQISIKNVNFSEQMATVEVRLIYIQPQS
ncbi:proteobacterial dedicated sortase system histidine kinase [Alteromonas sp. LMIT006]|uniref:proteobacterial dedicated sortase system histidine kinase n=1 Tax=Alteromonadaceae TaxID=72275 RepID=UPI0020CA8329|nr:proteobacterial dedicated sortase system histidine kinase [Alteromonas sp. LMIT006]UTP72764.1 proteobacterial dedicated sortase system histidine kinase [Alteromonas sp. LMIT006]